MPDQQTPSANLVFFPPTACKDDEISLIDLWRTLVARRKVVAGVFMATMLATGAYLLLTPPVYESRVIVQVGQEGVPLEDLAVFQQRLLADHSELASVETTKGGANPVEALPVKNAARYVFEGGIPACCH